MWPWQLTLALLPLVVECAMADGSELAVVTQLVSFRANICT